MGIKLFEPFFVDDGVSATKVPLNKRRAFMAFLDYCRQNKPKYAIVSKRDRLARNAQEYSYILKELKKAGTELVFFGKSEPALGKGVFGEFQEAIFMAFSELEATVIRQRILDTRKHLIKSGDWCLSTPPYGYRYNPETKGYDVQQGEIEIVKKIYRMYLEEKKGSYSIAKELNEQHVNSRFNGEWTVSSVSKVLTNPFYTGYQRVSYLEDDYEGKEIRVEKVVKSDKIMQCISQEDFEAAQQLRLSRNNKIKEPPRKYSTSFILSGLLVCKKCGAKFISRSWKDTYKRKDGTVRESIYKCYACPGGQQGKSCFRGTISINKIEKVVISEVIKNLSQVDPELVFSAAEERTAQKQIDLQTRKKTVEQLTGDLERRIESNQKFLEDSSSPKMRAYYSKRIEKLLDELEKANSEALEIEKRLENVIRSKMEKAKIFEKFKNWEERFINSTNEIKRKMLLDVVEKIEFDHIDRTVKIFTKFDLKFLSNNYRDFYDGWDSRGNKVHGIILTINLGKTA